MAFSCLCGADASSQDEGRNYCIWIATVLFGCAVGPILGFMFDSQNRLSTASERSAAVLIFGMNCE